METDTIGAPISSELLSALLEEEQQTGKSNRHWRIAAKTGALVSSYLSGLAYWGPNMKAAKGITTKGGKPLGLVLVIANTTSFGTILTWTYWSIIDHELRDGREIDWQHMTCGSATKGSARLVTATILGLAANVPGANLTYIQNGKRWYMPVIAVLFHSSISIYSFWRLLELDPRSLRCNRRRKPEIERKLDRARQMIVRAYNDILKEALSGSAKERSELSNTIGRLQRELAEVRDDNCSDEVEDFLKELVPSKALRPLPKKSYWFRACEASSLVCGVVLAAGFAAANYDLSREAVQSVYDDDVVGEIGATVIVSTLAPFLFDTVMKIPYNCVNRVRNLWYRKGEPDVAASLRPKAVFALDCVQAILGGLAWGPTVGAVQMYFDEEEAIVVEVISALAVVTMTASASRIIDRQIMGAYLRRWGKKDEKKVLNLESYIQKLKSVTTNCSYREIARLIEALPNTARSQMLETLSLQSSSLQSYIRRGISTDVDVDTPLLSPIDNSELGSIEHSDV